MDGVDTNGWSRYEKLVLSELAEIKMRLNDLEEGQTLTRIDVAQLKVKAGIWGGLAGLVPSAIGVLMVVLSSGGA